eukprot:c23484_g1_i1 orf=243-1523(+)
MGREICIGGEEVARSAVCVTRPARVNMSEEFLNFYQDFVKEVLKQHGCSFVITDPRLPDNPVVYASDGFLTMTGYSAEEALNRNCRFLQGRDTDRRTVIRIRDAIREERACQVLILNYTKQGRAFWNMFHMAPLYSKEDGRIIYFVGVQRPISKCKAGGLGNCFNSIASIDTSPLEVKTERRCRYVGNSRCYGEASCPNYRRNFADPDWEEEEKCQILEAERQRVLCAVRSLLRELTESSRCKGGGVTEKRCTTVANCQSVENSVCSSLLLAMTRIQQSFVLANPHLPDMPVVHASDMFLHLTGYRRDEVVGRNCRFLQGPETDTFAVQQMRECIKVERSCTARVLNYRKDKTPFWNFLHLAPVRNAQGKVAFFVGVQLDVTFANENEHQVDGMTPRMKQLGAIGAIRVAVRSLQGSGLHRVQEHG